MKMITVTAKLPNDFYDKIIRDFEESAKTIEEDEGYKITAIFDHEFAFQFKGRDFLATGDATFKYVIENGPEGRKSILYNLDYDICVKITCYDPYAPIIQIEADIDDLLQLTHTR